MDKLFLAAQIRLAKALENKDSGLEGIVVTLLIVVVAVLACVLFKNEMGNTMDNIIEKANNTINSNVFSTF